MTTPNAITTAAEILARTFEIPIQSIGFWLNRRMLLYELEPILNGGRMDGQQSAEGKRQEREAGVSIEIMRDGLAHHVGRANEIIQALYQSGYRVTLALHKITRVKPPLDPIGRPLIAIQELAPLSSAPDEIRAAFSGHPVTSDYGAPLTVHDGDSISGEVPLANPEE